MTTLPSSAIQTSRLKYTLGGLGALVLWSVSIPVSYRISEKIGPFGAGAWLQVAGCALGYLMMSRTQGFGARYKALPRPYLLIGGLLFVVYLFCYYTAIGLSDSREQLVEISLLNYLWPALGILFSIPILGKKAHWLLAPGLVLALMGVVLAVAKGSWEKAQAFVSGDIQFGSVHFLGLGCGITWALYSNAGRRLSRPGDANPVPIFMAMTGVVLFGLQLALQGEITSPMDAWPEILVLGLFNALAYGMWESSMRKGDQSFVLSASFLTPLGSVIATSLYLNVSINSGLWVACGLLIVGAVLCRKGVSG